MRRNINTNMLYTKYFLSYTGDADSIILTQNISHTGDADSLHEVLPILGMLIQ